MRNIICVASGASKIDTAALNLVGSKPRQDSHGRRTNASGHDYRCQASRAWVWSLLKALNLARGMQGEVPGGPVHVQRPGMMFGVSVTPERPSILPEPLEPESKLHFCIVHVGQKGPHQLRRRTKDSAQAWSTTPFPADVKCGIGRWCQEIGSLLLDGARFGLDLSAVEVRFPISTLRWNWVGHPGRLVPHCTKAASGGRHLRLEGARSAGIHLPEVGSVGVCYTASVSHLSSRSGPRDSSHCL